MKNRAAGPGQIATSRVLVLGIIAGIAFAQDRIKTYPGYDRYLKMSKEISGSVKRGSLTVRWVDEGKAFEYQQDGKNLRYEIAAGKAAEIPMPAADAGRGGRGGAGVARGRQAASALSPDGKLKAFYRERNIWLSAVDGANVTAITTDGSEKYRIKYGTASWVYGEELGQTSAMWWSPDGKYFVDVAQTHDVAPVTRLLDGDGKIIDELAKSDLTRFDQLGLKRVELLKYKAADGKTDLYGVLHFPSNFDPQKKYPLLVSVYGGPETNGAGESFATPSALTEYGFLYASLDSRSAAGRGKRFLDAIYEKLGITEIDDQAAGVKSLWDRPYLDRNRVGIFGTSYGGYASIMCLLRYPEVFQAASASSSPTDWRNYDTIYTERYMWLPGEKGNKAGYDAGSAMTYVKNMKGRLMLFYGTADNNVHPSNTMQLIQKLRAEGKSFEVQLGPDMGHSGLGTDRMMEFFIENLIINK